MSESCRYWDVLLQQLCGTSAPFGGYCGPHKRTIERDKLRAANPRLTHREAERLVPRFNQSAERKDIVDEAKALRYVLPHLKYREAKEKVLASRRQLRK